MSMLTTARAAVWSASTSYVFFPLTEAMTIDGIHPGPASRPAASAT